MPSNRQKLVQSTLSVLLAGAAESAWAAGPTAAEALQLQPVQKDVDYERPTAAEAAKATIKVETVAGQSGWVVRNGEGQLLRRFADTNNDNVVDLWCYYLGGIEVYRDIDQTYNGKADQYRWLNTAGTRWGLDTNEDGKIDTWKLISAEEVSAELVRAVADRDRDRFTRLLLTDAELETLGLGTDQAKALGELVTKAPERFKSFLASQGTTPTAKLASFGPKLKWVNFGGSQPGLIPAGNLGATKDITVYQNVAAMVQAEDKHEQLPIGTLVKVGDNWRLVHAPIQGEESAEQLALNSIFPVFPTTGGPVEAGGTLAAAGEDKGLQELMAKLEDLDKKLPNAAPADKAKLNALRADIMEQIADQSTGDARNLWYRQLADSISAAAQNSEYPTGVARLQTLKEKLLKNEGDQDLAAFIEFRHMAAEYGVNVNSPGSDFVKVQQHWLDGLRKYVEKYPQKADTAEAMLQLAMAEEFAGQEEEAKKWYSQIAANFPESGPAKKAAGAHNRLESVGKVIQLKGSTVTGQQFTLASLRGKVVVLHYWATWSPPCVSELTKLKDVQAKYAKDGLAIVSVSLDENKAVLDTFLKTNKLPWTQLFEPGGLESPLANALGILTMPSMLLIDNQGKVINRAIHVSELDTEIGKLIRK